MTARARFRQPREHPLLPAPRGPVRDLQLREYSALAALRAGTAQPWEVGLLLTSLRVAEVLAGAGYGQEHHQALGAAVAALRTAAPSADAVAHGLAIHDAQRRAAPARAYVAALGAVARCSAK